MKTLATFTTALSSCLASFLHASFAFACPESGVFASASCGACGTRSHLGEYVGAVGIGLAVGLGSVVLEGVLKKPKT